MARHCAAGIVRGAESEITAVHLSRMRGGREYLILHTHPSSAAFSQADAALFVPFPQLRVLAVIGADGTWYVLSIPPTRSRAELAGLDQAVAAEFVALRLAYVARRDAGVITSAEALRMLLHQVWLNMAERLGVRYDRLEPW